MISEILRYQSCGSLAPADVGSRRRNKRNLSVSERDIEIVALASWRVDALVEDGRAALIDNSMG